MGDLVVDALACWRLTHLIVADVFPPVQRARDAVLDRFGPDSPVSYLISCPACSGVWVGLGVVAARFSLPRMWRPVSQVLAVAAAAPLIEAAYGRLNS
jgi:hypothetical protein